MRISNVQHQLHFGKTKQDPVTPAADLHPSIPSCDAINIHQTPYLRAQLQHRSGHIVDQSADGCGPAALTRSHRAAAYPVPFTARGSACIRQKAGVFRVRA